MGQKMSRTRKTLINTLFSLMSQFLEIILSFVLRTAFIKILGDQYTGVASVFTTVLTMLSLSELGFATAVATALYKPLKENNEELIQQLMDFYKKAYRIVAGFIFVIGLLLIPFLHYIIKDVPDIKEDITIIYAFYIFKTAASYLMIYKTTLLRADQKLYIVKKYEMVCQLIRYAVEIVVLILFREYMTYLVIEVIATILQNYMVTRRAQREYSNAFKKPEKPLPKSSVISLLKDVKGLSMYKLSATVGNSIDTMLISSYINTSTVTLVGNYNHIKSHLQKVLMQFFIAVVPSVGNLAVESDKEHQKVVFDRLLYISFFAVNFFSVSMFVIIKPLIRVWLGERYILGVSISFVFAFDFFLFILLQAIASFRTANGLFVKGQYRPLVTAVVNIFLSVLLIRRYGIFGTIFATVIARLVTQWYDPYLLYKYIFKSGFARFYLTYWKYIIIFCSGAFLTDRINNLVSPDNKWLALIISGIVCVFIPNLWAILWTFRRKEFKYFCKTGGNVFKKLHGKKA